MSVVKYIKSFSKGQITIPKEVRDALYLDNEFWLKVSVYQGKIIAEPVEQEGKKAEWRKRLLELPPFDISQEEIKKNRKQMEKQINDRSV